MRTVSEYLDFTKTRYEKVIYPDRVEYRTYQLATISCNGIITDCGVSYQETMIVAANNEIDVIDYAAANPQAYEFVSNPNLYAKALGVGTIKDLIGMDKESFYEVLNERIREENGNAAI